MPNPAAILLTDTSLQLGCCQQCSPAVNWNQQALSALPVACQ
jgi:hypothetical protein